MFAMSWSLAVLPLVATILLGRRRSPLAQRLLDLKPHRYRPDRLTIQAILGLLILEYLILRGIRATPARADVLNLVVLDTLFMGLTIAIGTATPLSNRAWLVVATGVDVLLLILFAAAG